MKRIKKLMSDRALIEERLTAFEEALRQGKRLTRFGEFMYNDDKKSLVSINKELEAMV